MRTTPQDRRTELVGTMRTNSHDTLIPIKMPMRGGQSNGRVVHWNGISMVGERCLVTCWALADQSRKSRRDPQNQRRTAHRDCKEGQRHLQQHQADKRCYARLSTACQRLRYRIPQGQPARVGRHKHRSGCRRVSFEVHHVYAERRSFGR